MRPRRARTKAQLAARDRARRIHHDLATTITTLREDCRLSRRAVAAAAGISPSTQSSIEAGRTAPGIEVLARVAAVLGASLSVRLYPGTGPLLRDHLQAAMLQALLTVLHPRWKRELEVPVYEPARGVIDLVLEDRRMPPLVAVEAQSDLRRIEQQARWAALKSDGLASARSRDGQPATVSRLLLLRSTPTTRRVAREFAGLLSAAYPARHEDLLAALCGTAPWPGSGILWCEAGGSTANILERPPRGIALPSAACPAVTASRR